MSEHMDYGAPESAQPSSAVTGARSSVAPPLSADGLVPAFCRHDRASGRLRLADGSLLRETVCDTCGALLHVFAPLTYRVPPISSPMPPKRSAG